MESAAPNIKTEFGLDVTLVTLNDERIIEDQHIKALEDVLMQVVDKNEHRKLVLNFANVQFMSSAFLGLLVRIHKRVLDRSGQLQLVNLDPKIRKVFEITRLERVFDIS